MMNSVPENNPATPQTDSTDSSSDDTTSATDAAQVVAVSEITSPGGEETAAALPPQDAAPAETAAEAPAVEAPPKPSLNTSSVQIMLSPDKCTLSLNAEFEAELIEEFKEYMVQSLKKMGCRKHNIMEEALVNMDLMIGNALDFAQQARANNPHAYEGKPLMIRLQEQVLLTGTPPVEPQDARLEWAKDFFSQELSVDPDQGNVDYRERGNNLSVRDDQLLAILHPPQPGKAGEDVFGRILPARTPQNVKLRVAKNIKVDAIKGEYYSAIKGRLRFVNQILAVDNVYMIPGSVGLETGNISHPGALIVRKNIEAESRVETDGDIEVDGYIENAVVICGGNILVKGGIIGMEGYIRAAGTIHAKFIQNAEIEAGGDVIVERGIDQSNVRTRGKVIVNNGRIVGGHVLALQGVESDYIGTEANIVTTITSGEDFQLEELLEELEAQRQGYINMKDSIDKKIAPFVDTPHLPQNKYNILQTLKLQAEELARRITQTDEEINALHEAFQNQRVLEVLAKKEIYSDCIFHLDGQTLRSQDVLYGPVKVCIRGEKILCVGASS